MSVYLRASGARLTSLHGLVRVRVPVHVHVADALRVAHDRDGLGLGLDGPHQVRGPPGDHQVDVAL